ncbi:DUF4435 domain-containing protein [Streptomyces albogriseolus]|uniref:DUF4435 domain-containing protein n=1 Tax=Streptomyces albogriseolus TaxID=1887 RepID=UPI003796A188
MREFISAGNIANEVAMLRTTMSGPIVLLEGTTDSRLYRRFFLPQPHVRSIFCDGKPILLEAMSQIRRRRIRGVIAICDADYDRVLRISRGDGVHFADLHDAETMISYSDAFHRVFEELINRDAAASEVQRIRDFLIEVACTIGEIRLWSIQNEASLKFADTDAGEYLQEDGNFDLEGYASQVLEDSSSGAASVGELLSIAKERRFKNFGIEIASGHDFCSLLAADVRRRLQNPPDSLTASLIEAMLRLSFDAECFARTQLARGLDEWQGRNSLDLLTDAALPLGS